MTSYSQNGWRANDPSLIETYTVPGTNPPVRLPLRKGDAAVCLLWAAYRWDTEVESIEGSVRDDWGAAFRLVRGSTSVTSNHASGTAEDLDATKHPRGVSLKATFKPWQIAAVHAIIRDAAGVLRWGGDYRTAPIDGMHIEINAGTAAVAALAKKIRAGKVPGSWVGFPNPRPTDPVQEDDMPEVIAGSSHDTQALAAGAWKVLGVGKIGDRVTPSMVAGARRVEGTITIYLDRIPEGPVTVNAYLAGVKDGVMQVLDTAGTTEFAGVAQLQFHVSKTVPLGRLLRVRIRAAEAVNVTYVRHDFSTWKA